MALRKVSLHRQQYQEQPTTKICPICTVAQPTYDRHFAGIHQKYPSCIPIPHSPSLHRPRLAHRTSLTQWLSNRRQRYPNRLCRAIREHLYTQHYIG
ncbi:hypothetical protein FOXYSP1_14923 [Fusarium oxysporum f. sp. phaseoli]